MSGIIYRDAVAEDAAALAAFASRTFVDTFGHLYPPEDLAAYLSGTYGPAMQADEIAASGTRYVLAIDDGRIVGYCMMGVLTLDVGAPNGCELHRLYVDGDVKGAGVAHALMDDMLAWARAQGARAVYLSVWEENHRAQRFYKRYGFEHLGEHKFMVGKSADRDFIWRLKL